MARRRNRRRSSSSKPRRSARGGSASAIFQSILVGGAFGVIVLTMGFLYPPESGNINSLMLKEALSNRSGSGRNNQMSSQDIFSTASELAQYLSLNPNSLNMNSALEKDVVAYQQSKCDSGCKSRLRTKAESVLGSNWRTVAQKYAPMVKNGKIKANFSIH